MARKPPPPPGSPGRLHQLRLVAYGALLVAQVAVLYRFRHLLSGRGGGASAAASGALVLTPPHEPAPAERYSELSKWRVGDPLPPYVGRPSAGWAQEWPPEHGPASVPSSPGLLHLLTRDNDEAVRARDYGGRWRTPVVVVPAVYNELDETVPGWYVASLWSGFRSLYLYQRRDPDAPRYAPNFGTESGVYYRFIVDHYDDLPDVTVFVHSYPEAHNEQWLEWVHALRPNATYASMTHHIFFVTARAFDEIFAGEGGENPFMFQGEQCLRDIFDDAGAPLPPRARLIANQYCCAQVVVSRDQIRARPKAAYEKILRRIGTPPGLCHLGAPPRTDTFLQKDMDWPDPTMPAPKWDTVLWGDEVYDHFTGYGKQVVGHATEYSLSTVLGGTGFSHEMWTWAQYCEQFYHQCAFPGSPCRGPRSRPAELCPPDAAGVAYAADDELEPNAFAWEGEVAEEEEVAVEEGSGGGDGAAADAGDSARRLRRR
jgi:hypothetical protein